MFTDAFDSMLDATRIGCEYFYQGHTKVINDTKIMNMHGKIHQYEKGKAPNISLLVTNLSAFLAILSKSMYKYCEHMSLEFEGLRIALL